MLSWPIFKEIDINLEKSHFKNVSQKDEILEFLEVMDIQKVKHHLPGGGVGRKDESIYINHVKRLSGCTRPRGGTNS